jgi:hypothetical protein
MTLHSLHHSSARNFKATKRSSLVCGFVHDTLPPPRFSMMW